MHKTPIAITLLALAAVALPAAAQTADDPCLKGLTATANLDGGVSLEWPAMDGTDITGYQVMVRAEGGEWMPVQPQVPPSASAYTDAGAVAGTTYHYAVVAMKGDAQAGTYCSATATATASQVIEVQAGRGPPTAQVPFFPTLWALGAGVIGMGGATVLMVKRKK